MTIFQGDASCVMIFLSQRHMARCKRDFRCRSEKGSIGLLCPIYHRATNSQHQMLKVPKDLQDFVRLSPEGKMFLNSLSIDCDRDWQWQWRLKHSNANRIATSRSNRLQTAKDT